MHNANVPHDDRCRDPSASSWQKSKIRDRRIESHLNAEGPRTETGEEMDESERTARVSAPTARATPTYQEGGSSSSRSNYLISKRVKFDESGRHKRQGDDVEELEASAE